MSLIVKIQVNNDEPIEIVEIRRLEDRHELDRPTCWHYEVTRYSRVANTMRQNGDPTHVYHDTEDGAHRLAFLGLEATTEGETRDEAWLDARKESDAEIEEIIDDKDAFIHVQSHIIRECMEVINTAQAWPLVPDELYNSLRDYV